MTSNISINTISNNKFWNVHEKYILHTVSSKSKCLKKNTRVMLWRMYVWNKETCYREKIWVSIDDTNDVEGRYIANVIVRTLLSDSPGKIFLMTTEGLEKANFSTITKLFDNAMFLLWPYGIHYDDVLFLSDAASYMKKARETIKVLCPNIIHVTWLVHGSHKVVEQVRVHSIEVYKPGSSLKQIFFFLSPFANRVLFEIVNTGIPFSPMPILTRWKLELRPRHNIANTWNSWCI